MTKAVIVSRCRTPIGSFLGGLAPMPATKLGSVAISEALTRAQVEPSDVDEVWMGEVITAGVGQAPARQASIGAGLPTSVPCTTVNKVCGSGLKAVMLARDAILLNQADIVVAGGMESMSNAPYLLPDARTGMRMGDRKAVDSMILDGLFDPYGKAHMGTFGDLCASKYGFSRKDQDEFAKASYERALRAQKEGWFQEEIVPVEVPHKKGIQRVEHDEEPARYNPDKMPSLKPAFAKDGTVTPANASKINDGAAALVVMSEAVCQKRGLTPLAKIVSTATFAQDPAWFTTAPVGAIQKALKSASLSASDIDLFEVNEAFASVSMAAMKELSIPHEKMNVWGGAIALGHPIGCSGARLLTTLISQMLRLNKKRGCAALCLGGGEAVCVIVERDLP